MHTEMMLDTDQAEQIEAGGIARWLPAIARVLVGLIFTVMGLNGFFYFLPQPATMPEAATAFFGGLARSGYMLPLLSGTEVLVGVLFLSNRFVPLALVIIAPVVVNIICVHLFVFPTGYPLAALTAALVVYLGWSYRGAYTAVLAMRATPTGRSGPPAGGRARW
ncbi:MAG TPA: hypothetical protein VFS44_15655 [Gemmatimonadaceae bacterium]|nr:hypothetical protein [Gemmatimonadaceae bacterium]